MLWKRKFGGILIRIAIQLWFQPSYFSGSIRLVVHKGEGIRRCCIYWFYHHEEAGKVDVCAIVGALCFLWLLETFLSHFATTPFLSCTLKRAATQTEAYPHVATLYHHGRSVRAFRPWKRILMRRDIIQAFSKLARKEGFLGIKPRRVYPMLVSRM